MQNQSEVLLGFMAVENPFSFLGTAFLAILVVAVTAMGAIGMPEDANAGTMIHEGSHSNTAQVAAVALGDELAISMGSHQMAGGSCGACAAVTEYPGPDLSLRMFGKAKPGDDRRLATFADSPPQHPPRI